MCQCLFASASPTEFLEPFETNNRFPSTAKTPFSRVSRRNFDNSSFKGIDTGSCQTSCRFAQIDRLRNTRRKTHEGAVTVTRVYRSDDRHDFNIIYPPTKDHTQSVSVHIEHFKMGRPISKLCPRKKRETCKIFTYNNQSLRWGISHLSSLFHKRPNSTYYGGSSRLISWKVGR